MGDPAGIGPEIIVKALAGPEIYAICKPLIFGDSGALSMYGNGRLVIKEITHPSEADGKTGQVDLISLPFGTECYLNPRPRGGRWWIASSQPSR
jgi:4-hydroxythreonine-4-phosphate dehydrogenase